MLFCKLGTSKELDLEETLRKSDFAGCDPAIKPLT